jgi:glutathione S-transferase
MTSLGKRLGTKSYVMGESFTVPDLILGHCLGWATRIKWTLPEGPVSDYFDRISGREAFQKVLALRSAA